MEQGYQFRILVKFRRERLGPELRSRQRRDEREGSLGVSQDVGGRRRDPRKWGVAFSLKGKE